MGVLGGFLGTLWGVFQRSSGLLASSCGVLSGSLESLGLWLFGVPIDRFELIEDPLFFFVLKVICIDWYFKVNLYFITFFRLPKWFYIVLLWLNGFY